MADGTGDAASRFEADLGQLRGLARAGLAADDDDRVLLDGLADLLAIGRDRQLFRIGDLRHAGGARGTRRRRRGDPVRERGLRGGHIVAAQLLLAQAIALASQAELVAAKDGVEQRFGQ